MKLFEQSFVYATVFLSTKASRIQKSFILTGQDFDLS